MSQFWENIAAKTDKQYVAEDFQSTAGRLLAEQVLYYADRNSRMAYDMVERFERDFKHVLSQVGSGLIVNRQLRYACATPDTGKAGTATIAQTLLALVLRKIYDEQARTGQLNDDGEVICDLVELEEKYRLSTSGKRELPGRGELESLVKTLKRWGIVRKLDEQESVDTAASGDQPYVLAIRPAIVDLLGETAISRLAQFTQSFEPAQDSSDEKDGHDPALEEDEEA
jgi:hypothetical protein